ncbi:MAG: HAMP domain-containing histidine kinase [Alphaproteobacteria bacterium]|nr:HAMP domain-containing histidine kinase [Alphaproteobacteria bacterium]MCB9696809.1 HAMP domain-containing histidine kinase [Alphaproteobacteria bacterium]
MDLTLDPTSRPVLLLLLGVPAALSTTIGLASLRTLPKDATVVAFLVSVMATVAYQLQSLLPALAATDDGAIAWNRALAWSSSLMAATGLHFMALLDQSPLARRPLPLMALYGGVLAIVSAHLCGAIHPEVFPHPLLGRSLQPVPGLPDTLQRLYGGITIIALLGFASHYVWRWRKHPVRRHAAHLVAIGLLMPMVGAFAVVGRLTEWPLYHVTIPVFHTCLVLAIHRHGLLDFSIEDSARPAMDELSEGLLVVDRLGCVLYANRHALRSFGLGDQRLGAPLPEDSPLRAGAERALTGEASRGIPLELGGVPALASFAPLLHRGRPVVVVVLTDVRELRQTERQLVAAREEAIEARHAAEGASRAKSTFLANMSHELRTPLNAIIGYAELLEEERGGEQEELQRIVQSGRYLLRLLDDVLDLSKLDAGRLEVREETVALDEVLEELTEAVAVLAEQRGNTLTVRTAALVVRGDAVRIRQILLNLLSNANKFTENGRIDLLAEVSDGLARVSVRDTGVGMDGEQVSRLFRRFEQVHRAGHAEYGGTGLGLALSRELARRMAGDLTVESAPGVGSTFTLALSLAPDRASEDLPHTPAIRTLRATPAGRGRAG